MNKFLDKFIDLFKWPVAFYILLSTPAILSSFHIFKVADINNLSLFAGLVFFVFSKTMMDASVRTSMQVIAHEFTHSFFAVLTFHKINHIRINPDDTGGEMGFIGKGNWLIITGPYFFPLFCFIYICLMYFLPSGFIFHFILGYFLGYHIDTVFSQIHPEQTDLKKVGYFFCFIFLPGINLLTIGLILAYNLKGLQGMADYFLRINQMNISYISEILKFIQNLRLF